MFAALGVGGGLPVDDPVAGLMTGGLGVAILISIAAAGAGIVGIVAGIPYFWSKSFLS